MNKTDLEKFVNNNLSINKIAKEFNKSVTTIRYWMKKFGLQSKFKYPTVYDKIDWEECQRLYDTGLSWKELRRNGYSHNGICWAVKNNKLKFRLSSETNRLTHKLGKVDYSVYRTEKHKKIMSKLGGLRPNSGRCKHIKYTMRDGRVIDLQGTWELKLATFLDEKKMEWDRNRVGYKYIFDKKEKTYFPDFIFTLLDKTVYLEVKGYETEKDRSKWSQFPFPLQILKKNEIQDLESWYKTLI